MAKAQVGWWGQCQGPGHGERFALLYPRELAEVFRIFLLVEALELCGHFINPCKHWAFFLLPRKVISETHRLERKLQELSMGLGPKKCLGEVSQQNMDGFDAILVQTFTCLGATTAREPWSRVRGCGRGMAACGIDHNFHWDPQNT